VTRYMIDTDTPYAAGLPPDMLATYADLVKTNVVLTQLEAKHGIVVLIDRGHGDPLGKASVIDVERGARGVSDVRPWYNHQHAAGVRYLTVYANRTTMPQIDAAGWTGYRWYATLDGTAHIPGRPAGFAPAAIQCFTEAMLGYHADGSLVFEDNWHPAPPPSGAWVKPASALADQLAQTLRNHL